MELLIAAALGIIVGYFIGTRHAESSLDDVFRHYFHHYFEHYVGCPPGATKTVTQTGGRKTETETRRQEN